MEGSLKKALFSGFSFWVAIGLLGLYFLMPLRDKLRFGIDLVGGTYITLEVKTEKAVEAELIERLEEIKDKLQKVGVVKSKTADVVNNKIVLVYDAINQVQKAALSLKGFDKNLEIKVQDSQLLISFTQVHEKRIKEEAVLRNIEVLRTRLDKLSVAEISIAAQGERNIIVELPDVSDPQQAKAMIGTAAVLEFKIVEKQGRSKEDILYEYDGELPSGMEILPGSRGSEEETGYYLVPRRADLSGKYLKTARPHFDDQKGQMIVGFSLTPEGGDKFHELTSRNYGRNLAVILDNVVITAPVIQASIRSEGSIQGRFSSQEARELALLLKSGSFVAPVTFEEERQIGPSLGAESIAKGIKSCVIALALVFVFALFYYSVSGFFAFIALLYNLLLIMLGLAWLQATLTLPGIAGMVLTVGMAIDASILIFERIKEEIAGGAPVRKAVTVGFSDATRVILDSNITTLIVGIVLYRFGTGPIQGFAVTMILGIISTLITGLFFLRSLFMLVLNNFSIKKLRI